MAFVFKTCPAYVALWSLTIPSLVVGQYLSGVLIPGAEGISASCNDTFSSSVSCNSTLWDVVRGDLWPSYIDLTSICTNDCLSGLQNLRAEQISVCDDDQITVDGATYPATLNTDLLLFTYNYTCVTEPSSGDYCFPKFADINNQTDSGEECSDCNLLVIQAQLDSSLGWDEDLASAYSLLTSSCGISTRPVTSQSPYTLPVTATATATATEIATTASAAYACTATYTVQEGDTCESISEAQGVGTFYLLQANNLQAYCADFPEVGSGLCIPDGCDLYTVATNDTCYGIVQMYNGTFSVRQLISWNPNINSVCGNMHELEDSNICVSDPSYKVTTATASTAMTTATAVAVPTNVAPNTTTDCGKYYTVSSGDTCASISIAMGVSLTDFYFLNPMINSTCGNLWLDAAYCVEAVGSIATYYGYGQVLSAFRTTAPSGVTTTNDPCLSLNAPSSCFVTTYATTTFASWPAVGNDTWVQANPTATLTNDLPLAAGSLDSCESYTQWSNSNSSKGVNYNSCGAVAWVYGITIDELVDWNPSLTYDAGNTSSCVLQKGVRYCVDNGESVTSTATSAAPSATTTGNVSPDGTCGQTYSNYTCAGSGFGDCCSAYGYCGSSSDYCETASGCLPDFGTCVVTASTVTDTTSTTTSSSPLQTSDTSPDGTCGEAYGDYNCAGSGFGDCCSAYGYCGSGTDYCDASSGCQSDFGICNASSTTTTSAASATATSQPVSANGLCGSDNDGYTCAGSGFGDCCSAYGYCGSSTDYCTSSSGCQSLYGTCSS